MTEGSVSPASKKKNWKEELFILSRSKKQEGKESMRLNKELEISKISEQNIWIHPVFYFYEVLLKSQNISSAYLEKRNTFCYVCKRHVFFLYSSLMERKLTNDPSRATGHNCEALEFWRKTTWRIICLKKTHEKVTQRFSVPGAAFSLTVTDLEN